MKAALVEPDKTLIIRDIGAPELPKGGAVIRVTGCGICGSDLDKLDHRTLGEGTVLGHEVVGTIAELSPDAAESYQEAFPVGQRVVVAHHVPCNQCYYCQHNAPSMCRAFKKTNIVPGGFAEYIAVSADHLAHTVFPIPPEIPDAEASCMEPLACCIRAVERISPGVGDNVLVVGLGFIGMLSSQYLKYKGYKTFGIDLKPERVALARTHAMAHAASTDPAVILDAVNAQTEGRGADVVFLSVVNPATLDLALTAVRDGGLILLFTSYGPGDAILDQNALYFRELTVLTSYSPSLQHLQLAYDLIVQNQIQVEPLISHQCPLSALNEGMACYRSGEALKVFVTL